jgi:hypothetical protein
MSLRETGMTSSVSCGSDCRDDRDANLVRTCITPDSPAREMSRMQAQAEAVLCVFVFVCLFGGGCRSGRWNGMLGEGKSGKGSVSGGPSGQVRRVS